MAFKLAKGAAVRPSDMVDDIPADSTSLPLANIVNGRAVQIAADGELEQAAPGVAVAGILVNEAGEARYAAPSGETYTPTFKNTDKTTFIPVTGSLMIEADYTGTPTAAMIGDSFGLDNADQIDLADTINTDFRVVRFKYANDGTTVTKLLGFFTTPGYFTS